MDYLDFEKSGALYCLRCKTNLLTKDSLHFHLSLSTQKHNIQPLLTLKKLSKKNILNFTLNDLKYCEKLLINEVALITEKISDCFQKITQNLTQTEKKIEELFNISFYKSEDFHQFEVFFTAELQVSPEIVKFLNLEKNFYFSADLKKFDRVKVSDAINSLNFIQMFKKRATCSCQYQFNNLSQLKSHLNCSFMSKYTLKPSQYSHFTKILSKKINFIEKIKNKLIKKLEKLQNLENSVSDFFLKLNKWNYLLKLEFFTLEDAEDFSNNYQYFHQLINHNKLLLTMKSTLQEINTLEKALEKDVIIIKELEDYKKLEFFSKFLGKIKAFCFNPSKKKVFIGSADSTIRCFRLLNKLQDFILFGHTSKVTSLVLFNKKKSLVSGSYDRTIRIWNLKNRVHTILRWHPKYPVSSISMSPSDENLAVSHVDGEFAVYRISNNEKIHENQGIIKSKFISDNLIVIQFSEDVSFLDIEMKIQEKFKEAYNFTVSNQVDFLLFFKKSVKKETEIWKYDFSEKKNFFLLYVEVIVKESLLLNNDKNLVLLSNSSIFLISLCEKSFNKRINFPGLDDSKILNLKLSNKFIVFNKKSKIFTVKLSKTSTKVKKFLKIPIFHQSKTIKSLNFLYFPTSSYFLTYNLSTHKIKSQKLPEVPSCLKISIANQLLLLSFQGKIQGYNISPFKPFLIHTTKDKINSLAINSIGTTFAASYLDSKDNLSYILLINLSRDIKKCIETKISDPLLCLEFSKSLENLASISSKGKVSIWTSDTCKNVKSIDLNYPFPLKLSFSLKEKFLYLSFRNESIMSLDIKTQEKTKITSFDLFQLKNDLDENDFEGFTYLV